MLNFLENKMTLIAPNVSAIVGTRVAAKLIAAAGGIVELSRIPAGNIQVLGQQKKGFEWNVHSYSIASPRTSLRSGFGSWGSSKILHASY